MAVGTSAPTISSPLYARSARLLVVAVLALIVMGAAWLRVSGHNWDENQHLNADDLYVAKVTYGKLGIPRGTTIERLLDVQRSPLNPRINGEFYVYGTLPIYMVKATSGALVAVTGDRSYATYDGVLQTGRVLSGLFDVQTLLIVFGIALRLSSAWAGLVAAALYACAILPIQTGHFYLVDGFMNTFMAATLLFSLLAYQTKRAWWLVGAGLCAGLALACKVSAVPVVLLPLLAALLLVVTGASPTGSRPTKRLVLKIVAYAALVVVALLFGWFAGDPYGVADLPTYFARLGEQAAITNGATDEWWARKYVGTWPVLYAAGQLVLLGAGPLVGLAGLAGALITAVRGWRARQWDYALLFGGSAVYFVSIALAETKWVRYLEPLVPYLCLFATSFVLWLCERAGKRAGQVAGGVLVVVGLAGALAVSSIYHTPQTQVQASRWLYANVPKGAPIAIETTTVSLPLPLPGHSRPAKEYTLVGFDPLADQPNTQAAEMLRASLDKADYVVLDMTQAALTVPRLRWRYPVQIRFYDLLLRGELGYAPAFTATSYPTLFGLAIPDDGLADASFMDSSHPPIRILKKTRSLSKEEWDRFFADAIATPARPTRRAP